MASALLALVTFFMACCRRRHCLCRERRSAWPADRGGSPRRAVHSVLLLVLLLGQSWRLVLPGGTLCRTSAAMAPGHEVQLLRQLPCWCYLNMHGAGPVLGLAQGA